MSFSLGRRVHGQAIAVALDADFRESDHPRDDDGKFGAGGGGGAQPKKRKGQRKDDAEYERIIKQGQSEYEAFVAKNARPVSTETKTITLPGSHKTGDVIHSYDYLDRPFTMKVKNVEHVAPNGYHPNGLTWYTVEHTEGAHV